MISKIKPGMRFHSRKSSIPGSRASFVETCPTLQNSGSMVRAVVIVPITLSNPEDISLKGIKLTAVPNTEDLSGEFDKNYYNLVF